MVTLWPCYVGKLFYSTPDTIVGMTWQPNVNGCQCPFRPTTSAWRLRRPCERRQVQQSADVLTPTNHVCADSIWTGLVALLWLVYEYQDIGPVLGPTGAGKTMLMNA